MREAPYEQRGCYGGCGVLGCVVTLAALFLPVAQCFGGGSVSGFEVLPMLPVLAFTTPGGVIILYVNVAAVMAFVALVRGRVSGLQVIVLLPAAIIPWLGV